MIIRVQTENFDIAALNHELLAGRTDVGAIASFARWAPASCTGLRHCWRCGRYKAVSGKR
mgnify:CR=1 FL=1